MFSSIEPIFLFLLIVIAVIPGLIASTRKQKNSKYIWVLTVLAPFTSGLTWLIAAFWLIWPKEAEVVWFKALEFAKAAIERLLKKR